MPTFWVPQSIPNYFLKILPPFMIDARKNVLKLFTVSWHFQCFSFFFQFHFLKNISMTNNFFLIVLFAFFSTEIQKVFTISMKLKGPLFCSNTFYTNVKFVNYVEKVLIEFLLSTFCSWTENLKSKRFFFDSKQKVTW